MAGGLLILGIRARGLCRKPKGYILEHMYAQAKPRFSPESWFSSSKLGIPLLKKSELFY